jgi:hypothetical protein
VVTKDKRGGIKKPVSMKRSWQPVVLANRGNRAQVKKKSDNFIFLR